MVTPTNQASILFPCVLLSAGSSDRCYFFWAIRRGKSVAPRAFENCLLYDRLKDWYYIGPADELAAEPDAFISNAARQIEEFGISLEDLWLYQQSDVPCPHCQDLLALIENDDFLQFLLENRKFTQLQKDDHFADLASLYPEWLEQEVAATLHGPRL